MFKRQWLNEDVAATGIHIPETSNTTVAVI